MFITYNNLTGDKLPKRLKLNKESSYEEEAVFSEIESGEDVIVTSESGLSVKELFKENEEILLSEIEKTLDDSTLLRTSSEKASTFFPLRNDYNKDINTEEVKEDFENSDSYAALKERNNANKAVGYIYIEPWYYIKKFFEVKNLVIPFEFNPTISESSSKANYEASQFLNRVNQIRTYVSGEPSGLTIEATYLALAPDEEDNSNVISLHEEWQRYYTPKRLKNIELMYRSLVLPYSSAQQTIKPMLVQVFRSSSGNLFEENANGSVVNSISNHSLSIGDFYNYPTSDNILQVTKAYYDEAANFQKRYVVLDVSISEIDTEQFILPSSYNANENIGWKKIGFKVTLTLAETNTSFLDILPTFSDFFNAWTEQVDKKPDSIDQETTKAEGENETDQPQDTTKKDNTTEAYISATSNMEKLADKISNPKKYLKNIYSGIVNDAIKRYLVNGFDKGNYLRGHSEATKTTLANKKEEIIEILNEEIKILGLVKVGGLIKQLEDLEEHNENIKDYKSKIVVEEAKKETNFISFKGIVNGSQSAINTGLNLLTHTFSSYKSYQSQSNELKNLLTEAIGCVDDFRAILSLGGGKDPNDTDDFKKWANDVSNGYDKLMNNISTLWGVKVNGQGIFTGNVVNDVNDFKNLTSVCVDGINACADLIDASNWKIITYKAGIQTEEIAIAYNKVQVFNRVASYNIKINSIKSKDKKNGLLSLSTNFKKVWIDNGNIYDVVLPFAEKITTNIQLAEAKELLGKWRSYDSEIDNYISHYESAFNEANEAYKEELKSIKDSAAIELASSVKLSKETWTNSKEYDKEAYDNLASKQIKKIESSLKKINNKTGLDYKLNGLSIAPELKSGMVTYSAHKREIQICEICEYTEHGDVNELMSTINNNLTDIEKYEKQLSEATDESNKNAINKKIEKCDTNIYRAMVKLEKISDDILKEINTVNDCIKLINLYDVKNNSTEYSAESLKAEFGKKGDE